MALLKSCVYTHGSLFQATIQLTYIFDITVEDVDILLKMSMCCQRYRHAVDRMQFGDKI